ncbi:MAG TPA: putative LPS assembly protein LptD [Chitinophagales bacterium]|nr:putative LPS assembly protein LptD [Chitinophagales bacterium]HNK97041.1 putative LPS assembly protein LptD [Chitinophagales bacterium]
MAIGAHSGNFVYNNVQTNEAFVYSSAQSVPDSSIAIDSTKNDSLLLNGNDLWYAVSPDALDQIINYKGVDSIIYDLDSGKTYIYAKGEITYQSFNLKADFIVFDWAEKTICAKQITDSTGKKGDLVYFKDGDEEFKAEYMCYNFGTKKGKIHYFRAQEGEGYIAVEQAKKNDDDSYYGDHLTYTTCELDHPHFYITAEKAKVVPQKVAVTGPANLVIADVPTPLFLPFGIFPIKRGQTSGIIIPQYGNLTTQGFFLKGGGYYFALSDYYDLMLTGDIYSRGSWGLHTSSRYNLRYKFNGALYLDYAVNKYDFPFSPNYSENTGYYIRWSHSQDAKSTPNSKFSASVNLGSTNYLKDNSYSSSYLSNSLNSSISYGHNFVGTPFNFTAALRHSQNISEKTVNATLPEAALTMNRIYPLKKLTDNKNSFMYQLGVTYSMNMQNSVSRPDSLFFDQATLDAMRSGFQHKVSASAPVKVLKYFTFSPNVNYTENWYFESIRKRYDPYTVTDTIQTGTGEDSIITTEYLVQVDTVEGFSAARYYSMGASLNTKIYSLAQFNGKLKAIRHVMTPTLSFNYTPDFSLPKYGYYGEYYPTASQEEPTLYSIYEGGVYSGPGRGEMGTISLGIGNTLEMKVYSKKDSVTHEKKVKLLENFSVSGGYNLAADSLNFSDIGFSAYTTLFKNIRINVNGSFDPYILDTLGRNIDQFEWDVNHRIGRFNSGNISLSTDFQSKRNNNPSLATNAGTEEEREMVWNDPSAYIDFEVPWSFAVGYNLRVTNAPTIDGRDSIYTTQSATFNGDLSLTPNWKVQVTTGYDVQQKEFTYTSIDIYRDLHCWQMSFKWIPFGLRQSYVFNINVKASVLQDLKLTRKKDWSEY